MAAHRRHLGGRHPQNPRLQPQKRPGHPRPRRPRRPADVLPFLSLAAAFGHDLDIMVEAKRKDEAMFRLVEALAAAPGVSRAGQTALEL